MLACEGVAAGPRSPWSAPPTAATAGAGPRAAGEPAGTAAGRAASTTAAPGAARVTWRIDCHRLQAVPRRRRRQVDSERRRGGDGSPWSEAPRSDTPGRGPAAALARSVPAPASIRRTHAHAPDRPRPRITAAPGVFTGVRVVTVCGSSGSPGVVSARTPRPDAGSVAARPRGRGRRGAKRGQRAKQRRPDQASPFRTGPPPRSPLVPVPVTPDTAGPQAWRATGTAAVGGGGGGAAGARGGRSVAGST